MAENSKARGNKMKCHLCAGEMKKGKATYTLNRDGYHLLIHDVSAWICSHCSEVYFEENAVDMIQRMIKDLDIQVNELREATIV
jgi:YgiT-type zinc finger domain-containing protein